VILAAGALVMCRTADRHRSPEIPCSRTAVDARCLPAEQQRLLPSASECVRGVRRTVPYFAARNTKHFMHAGMVVNVIVNAVSPRIAPSFTFKQLFEHGRRIEVVGKSDCAAIDDKRPLRMIRNDPIILKAEGTGLPFADEHAEGAAFGATSR